ncbi:MAG: PD-(D/E)XK nuclease family protein [Candidatus Sericytochromatia bacterium]|nr:PD-(D/E)XK nuclease family protein [Candidatus Sericytochromatia bacterium]
MTQVEPRPRLSSAALDALADGCPRYFALRYKLQAYWPARAGQHPQGEDDGARLGSVFHRLVQQHACGLPLAPLLEAWEGLHPGLTQMWARFATSEHFSPPLEAEVWTEQSLHLQVAEVPFVARYDRIVAHAGRWRILDWKTGHPSGETLRRGWQARLYPFVLTEAAQVLSGGSPIAPESVEMVFWLVDTGEAVVIPHSASRHEATRQRLTALARQACAPFDPRVHDDAAFPRVPSRCPPCAYHTLCNAGPFEPSEMLVWPSPPVFLPPSDAGLRAAEAP